MKKLLSLLAVLLLLVALAAPASAATYADDPILMDRAGLLSPEEKATVSESISRFIQEKNCHLLVITDTVFYSSNADLSSLLSRLQSRDLIILTVTYAAGSYFYDLFTYEGANKGLSDLEVDAILDADGVYTNLKGGRIAEGLVAFVSETEKHLDPIVDRPAGWYTTPEKVLTSCFMALIGAVVCCIIVVARYKMKIKPTNYPLDRFAKLNLTEEKDIFTGSFVTKHRVSSSSSGGGRSGGHRGGR